MTPIFLTCFILLCTYCPVSSCSTGMLKYEFFYSSWPCIYPDECRHKNMVIEGDKCIPACTSKCHFFDDATRTCFENCPADTVIMRHLCINKRTCTDKEQVVLNGACADACSDSYPLLDDSVCYQQCPSETVANGTVCVHKNTCIQSGSFVYSHTCVESCPITSGLKKDGECVSSCPEGSLSNGTVCMNDEDCFGMKKVIFNKTCLNDCPPLAPYNIKNRCYDHCPSGFLLEGAMCIPELDCRSRLKVIHEGTCVEECPFTAPFVVEEENRCSSTCSPGYVRINTSCISESKCFSVSGLYYFVFNGTCVESCPPSAPLDSNHVCRDECEDISYKYGTECITREICKSRGFIYNRACVPHCPENSSLVLDRECFEKCPDMTLADGSKCIRKEECFNRQAVQFEGKCLDRCPSEAPYDCQNTCLARCTCIITLHQDYDTEPLDFNGTECVSHINCTGMGMFVYNRTCISKCPVWTVPDTKKIYYRYDVCRSVVNLYRDTVIIAICFVLCLAISIRLWYIPRHNIEMEENQVNHNGGIILEMDDDENKRLNPEGDENPGIFDVQDNGGMDRQMGRYGDDRRMNKDIIDEKERRFGKKKNKRFDNDITMVDINCDQQPLIHNGDEDSDDSEMLDI